jgi:NAD(P)-dependent dehydrogenase (short-subunit alcohol dehydrogenase family)
MSTDLFSLAATNVIVTGASGGIGRRLAVGLAEAGADVACIDLPDQRAGLDETTSRIQSLGRRSLALAADVTSTASINQAIATHENQIGPLNGAVNCAGINNSAAAEEMSEEQWRRLIDVNLTGIFLSCQAEASRMLAQGSGAIVNIASMSATIANRGLWQAHYNASKAGVKHLTTTLALEWARRGVRVNSLSPGYIATPMTSGPEWEEKLTGFAEDTPLGRIGNPDDLVGPAVFLLSSAAAFCIGTDLIVDGGFTGW